MQMEIFYYLDICAIEELLEKLLFKNVYSVRLKIMELSMPLIINCIKFKK